MASLAASIARPTGNVAVSSGGPASGRSFSYSDHPNKASSAPQQACRRRAIENPRPHAQPAMSHSDKSFRSLRLMLSLPGALGPHCSARVLIFSRPHRPSFELPGCLFDMNHLQHIPAGPQWSEGDNTFGTVLSSLSQPLEFACTNTPESQASVGRKDRFHHDFAARPGVTRPEARFNPVGERDQSTPAASKVILRAPFTRLSSR